MPKRHPPDERAAAVAAVATGEPLSDVARRFGVSKGRLSEWCKTDIPAALALDGPEHVPERIGTAGGVVRAMQQRTLAELVRELVAVSIETLTLQARVAGRESWVERQSASGLAEYRGVELDRLIRILPAFEAADTGAGDALDGDVVDAAARPADDGD